MSVKAVYSSPAEAPACVIGYLHDDGMTAILLSPTEIDPGLTVNIHWTVAEARQVAAMLVAAADAAEEELGDPVEDALEGRAAMERAK